MKQLNIFNAKEMYALTHTREGIPIEWEANTSRSIYRKKRYDNLLLSEGMKFTEGLGLPIMQPYTSSTDFEIHSFKERHRLDGKGQTVHFFGDDYTFDGLLWHRLPNTTMELYKFECVIAPDYSVYVDLPFSYNLGNIYKNRFVGAYWQLCGYNVISTASWGDANSLKYSFEGLPTNSVIAVCGTGHDWCASARKLWEYGMREMEARLQPILVLVYGPPTNIPGFITPVKFIEDHITNRIRKAI